MKKGKPPGSEKPPPKKGPLQARNIPPRVRKYARDHPKENILGHLANVFDSPGQGKAARAHFAAAHPGFINSHERFALTHGFLSFEGGKPPPPKKPPQAASPKVPGNPIKVHAPGEDSHGYRKMLGLE